MCCDNFEQILDQLNPIFLFTWTGTRFTDETSYHCHDHIEIAFVLSGHGRYRIMDQFYDVSEGDLILLNPNQKHQALVTDISAPTTEFFVGFSDIQFPGMPKNHLPLNKISLAANSTDNSNSPFIASDASPVLHTTGELRQKLFKLCTSMSAENDICRQGRYIMLKSYLMQLLILLLREQCEPIKVSTSCSFDSVNKKYLVEQMVNYLEDHYAEKISLDQIAENMYLSPFYISRIFKSETGDTPIHHLINIRLEKAKELLEKGFNGSIQEIAATVGYDDVYHFSKLFKKRYGIPPSQIRK